MTLTYQQMVNLYSDDYETNAERELRHAGIAIKTQAHKDKIKRMTLQEHDRKQKILEATSNKITQEENHKQEIKFWNERYQRLWKGYK